MVWCILQSKNTVFMFKWLSRWNVKETMLCAELLYNRAAVPDTLYTHVSQLSQKTQNKLFFLRHFVSIFQITHTRTPPKHTHFMLGDAI